MSGMMEKASDTPIFNYTIASADMRYIEIGERVIYLRADPERGLVVRGEIQGCGPGCYVDLSQVFLEFTMSCEGCRDEDVVKEAVNYFGERMGKILSSRLYPNGGDIPSIERLTGVFECVYKSMDLPFTVQSSEEKLYYSFSHCPFCDREEYAGFIRTVEMARLGFIALCESILQNVAPGWVLVKPEKGDIKNQLLEVLIMGK